MELKMNSKLNSKAFESKRDFFLGIYIGKGLKPNQAKQPDDWQVTLLQSLADSGVTALSQLSDKNKTSTFEVILKNIRAEKIDPRESRELAEIDDRLAYMGIAATGTDTAPSKQATTTPSSATVTTPRQSSQQTTQPTNYCAAESGRSLQLVLAGDRTESEHNQMFPDNAIGNTHLQYSDAAKAASNDDDSGGQSTAESIKSISLCAAGSKSIAEHNAEFPNDKIG